MAAMLAFKRKAEPSAGSFEALEKEFRAADHRLDDVLARVSSRDAYVSEMAKLEEPEARASYRRLRAELEHRRVEQRNVERAAEAAARAACLEKIRPLAERLSIILGEAATVNAEILAIELEGAALNPLAISWPELHPETPVQETRLGAWRRVLAKDYGWL